MNKNILIVAELNNVSVIQRQTFRTAMEQQNWSSHPRMTNIWTGSFERDVNEVGAISTAKNGVASAAAQARIPSFEVLIHIGTTEPEEYSVRPEAVL